MFAPLETKFSDFFRLLVCTAMQRVTVNIFHPSESCLAARDVCWTSLTKSLKTFFFLFEVTCRSRDCISFSDAYIWECTVALCGGQNSNTSILGYTGYMT